MVGFVISINFNAMIKIHLTFKTPAFFMGFLLLALFSACDRSKSYQLTKNNVGPLNSSTQVFQLSRLFKDDSIKAILSEGVLGYQGAYSQEDDRYFVYSKKGAHLLTITPKEPLDSLSTLRNVVVHDPRYTTPEGLGLDSSFAEIHLLTRIGKVETTFTQALLFLDDLNATMTLNKADLGLRTSSLAPIQLEQIPDQVKPPSLVCWFD